MRVALIGLALLCASCGLREETPRYFTETTGIPLCPTAKVRDVAEEGSDSAGIGMIYTVDLVMDEPCLKAFGTAVARFEQGPSGDASIQVSHVGDAIRVRYID